MKFPALITDSIREIYSKKIIIGLIAVEAIILAITALALNSEGMQAEYDNARESWNPTTVQSPPGSSTVEFSTVDSALLEIPAGSDSSRSADSPAVAPSRALTPPRSSLTTGESSHPSVAPALLEKVRGQLASLPVVISLGVLFLGLFATAGTVPSMMEKGTIELLLSKPVSRTSLLLGRALGGVSALAVNHALFVTALWALYGSASGVWLTSFLVAAILVPLFTYAVVYSGVVYLSILTESWVLPMSIAYLHVSILASFLYGREATLFSWIEGEWLHRLIDGLYWILPQTSDLGVITMNSVSESGIDSWGAIVQGLVFISVMTSLSAWRFSRKDF